MFGLESLFPVELENLNVLDELLARISDISLHCTCKQPDDGSWMIQCCTCEIWFHGKCIANDFRSENDAAKMMKYNCSSCQSKNMSRRKSISPFLD